jgi:hypothetical protein
LCACAYALSGGSGGDDAPGAGRFWDLEPAEQFSLVVGELGGLREVAFGAAEWPWRIWPVSEQIVRHVSPVRFSATRMIISARKQIRTSERIRSSLVW